MQVEAHVKKVKRAHEVELKNVKLLATKQAIEFLRKKSKDLITTFTKTHHELLDKFLTFRAKTNAKIRRIA